MTKEDFKEGLIVLAMLIILALLTPNSAFYVL